MKSYTYRLMKRRQNDPTTIYWLSMRSAKSTSWLHDIIGLRTTNLFPCLQQ